MKKTIILTLVAIAAATSVAVLLVCKRETPGAPGKGKHTYTMKHVVGNMYRVDDPDCPLCKEMRRQEIIAVVDSMLHERR